MFTDKQRAWLYDKTTFFVKKRKRLKIALYTSYMVADSNVESSLLRNIKKLPCEKATIKMVCHSSTFTPFSSSQNCHFVLHNFQQLIFVLHFSSVA
jgi:hypothetical protein